MILVINTSLKHSSRSRVMGEALYHRLKALSSDVQLVDLREHPLPFCDAGGCYGDPNVKSLGKQIAQAKGVVLATPVYNYDASAATKNLVELTGKDAWENKIVGFVCAAGGYSSYMSIMALANSLMLDFRCLIAPRFVYATGKSYEGAVLNDAEIVQRIDELACTMVQLTRALPHGANGKLVEGMHQG